MQLTIIECDFNTSTKCLKKHYVGYYNCKYNKKRNGGKYKCYYCAKPIKYPKNEKFFNKIHSEEQAYLLGIIAGDGSIDPSNYFYVVSHKHDLETLKLFQKFICRTAPIKMKKSKREKNCRYIYISSMSLVTDICKHLNIKPGKKSDKLTLPHINRTNIWHFLRGLMDSDGSILNPHILTNKTPLCSFKSASAQLLKDIKYLTDSLGIKSFLTKNRTLNFCGVNAIQILDLMYKNAKYKLSRKYEYFLIWKTWTPYKGIGYRKLYE